MAIGFGATLGAMGRVRAAANRLREWARARWPRDRLGWVELAVVVAALAYVVTFVVGQTDGLLDPYVREWDARANVLPALRWHGSRLFAGDLLVDFAATQNPPLWRAIYWIGTLWLAPDTIAKWLPFPLFAVVVWQAWAFGRRAGGPVGGATAAVLLVHCNFLWDRMVGGNARAFGFPLVVAFLRYAAERRERAVLVTLGLMALAYPSAFVFCAPAWGLALLAPDETHGWAVIDRRWLRFVLVGAGAAAVAAWFAFGTDPRIGHAVSLDELARLGERNFSALWPLPEARPQIEKSLGLALYSTWGPPSWLSAWHLRSDGALALATAAALLGAAGRRLRALPAVLPALLASSLVAFAVAQALAYRLYFPDRMLQYAWPPLMLLGLVAVGQAAWAGLGPRRAALLTALTLGALELGCYGDGLMRDIGLHDWHSRETPLVRAVARLPEDALVAASFDQASAFQYLAHRKVLFSAISNIPHHDAYARELERRIRAYYLAYYARDWAAVRAFAAAEHVDYLVVDARDFGPRAYQRAKYAEPWTQLAHALVLLGPPDRMVLAHPPPSAVLFHDGPLALVDLRKL